MPTAKCIYCKNEFQVDEDDLGKVVSCPRCGFKYRVWKDSANNIRAEYPDLDVKESMSARNMRVQGAN